MRYSILLFLSFSLLITVFAFQNTKTETKPLLVGQYYASDTNASRDFCKGHTLTLKADSTFTFYSMCLNSEGKWTYKNKKLILNSKFVKYGWTTGNLDQDKDYDAANNNLRIRILGYNKKPIVCEEINCLFEGKLYTQFTDKEGCAYFPVEKFDSIYYTTISDYYREAWKKYPTDFADKVSAKRIHPTPWFGVSGSFTLYYTVNNEYQHYTHFKDLEFSFNKENMLVPNTTKQNQTVKTDLPQIPFGKKMKKK